MLAEVSTGTDYLVSGRTAETANAIPENCRQVRTGLLICLDVLLTNLCNEHAILTGHVKQDKTEKQDSTLIRFLLIIFDAPLWTLAKNRMVFIVRRCVILVIYSLEA